MTSTADYGPAHRYPRTPQPLEPRIMEAAFAGCGTACVDLGKMSTPHSTGARLFCGRCGINPHNRPGHICAKDRLEQERMACIARQEAAQAVAAQ